MTEIVKSATFVVGMISVFGNVAVILFVHFNGKKDQDDKELNEKLSKKADKDDTNLIFKFIREMEEKIDINLVKKSDCKDFKARIGKESDDHRKNIESLRIGMAVLLERNGVDPKIMDKR